MKATESYRHNRLLETTQILETVSNVKQKQQFNYAMSSRLEERQSDRWLQQKFINEKFEPSYLNN
jgi:hypothetical protein